MRLNAAMEISIRRHLMKPRERSWVTIGSMIYEVLGNHRELSAKLGRLRREQQPIDLADAPGFAETRREVQAALDQQRKERESWRTAAGASSPYGS